MLGLLFHTELIVNARIKRMTSIKLRLNDHACNKQSTRYVFVIYCYLQNDKLLIRNFSLSLPLFVR